ncbi:MAG TPA: IclR family transcriptional regulator [Xanthobacteraceae bacterium]|nr:IclR family transcriptional regulator [Xanthobacteraceae bacterium]
MGRRSERLSRAGFLTDASGGNDVIQVVSRAFDVLRCFEGHETRLGNLEISNRCGLPRSTVSRLTHTLTRMGQLIYLPQDQKYRIGPSAVAMSTSMMRGLQIRDFIRAQLRDVAKDIPGTVGFVIPDRFQLVYLEYARSPTALGLHSAVGTRIGMGSTAAGHAYVAALDPDCADALVSEMEREIPADAAILRPRMEANRRHLEEHGYVVACGLWSPHINGIAAPIWSPQYQTYAVLTIGVLAAMYDERRLHSEVAGPLRELVRGVGDTLSRSDSNVFHRAPEPPTATQNKTIVNSGGNTNELAAGTRRSRPPRSLRAADGRR